MSITEKQLSRLWLKYQHQLRFKEHGRWSVVARLEKNEKKCLATLSHLQPELGIFDEGLLFANCLNEWLWSLQALNKTSRRGKALMLLGRICTYLGAIRKLLTCGFEDPIRPLLRTMLESMDLLLAIVVDESLNDEYGKDDPSYDETEFWKKHVAFGRIDNKLQEMLTRCGFDEAASEQWILTRKKFRKFLSGATHTDSGSALRSVFIFSLVHRGRICVTTYGHHSIHSPGFLHNIARVVSDIGSLIVKLIMSPNPPEIIDAGPSVKSGEFQTMLVSFFTLQEISSRALAKSRSRQVRRKLAGRTPNKVRLVRPDAPI